MKYRPDFLIIGSMKCGTTSLYDYLQLNSDIFVTDPKELHFFDDNNFSPKNIHQYFEKFKTTKLIRGSAPQNYTKCHLNTHSKVPKRLNEYFPDLKLIYVIRNPFERIESHFREAQEGGYAPPGSDLNQYLREDLYGNHYVMTSRYGYQIQHYLDYFDKSQIMIISSTELLSQRLRTVNKVCEFLGATPFNDSTNLSFESNSGIKKKRLNTIGQLIYNKNLDNFRSLFTRSFRDKVIHGKLFAFITREPVERQLIDSDIKEKLIGVFREDYKILRDNFDIDIDVLLS